MATTGNTRADQINAALGNAEKAYDTRTKAQQDAEAAKDKEKDRDFARIKEKTEILDGSRNKKVIALAAVRFVDLAQLYKFPSAPTAVPVTSAPTADQYNALLADVKKVYEVLGAISTVVNRRF